MSQYCQALCMDMTLDQNFITIVVFSDKKKSYLLLIVRIRECRDLEYLTHFNLSKSLFY